MGFVDNSPIYLEPLGENLKVTAHPESFSKIGSFFRFDDPLEKIVAGWESDPALKRAALTFPGLRLIRQDPWTCLVGFILSIVSNIPKIETSLDKIARHSGESVSFLGRKFHRTPSPETIERLRESTLRKFGIGFRARYLKGCAQALAQGFPLESLTDLPYYDAKLALMELPGIGEKVADCILLFGLGHLKAFPVDVWMKRILERFYFGGRLKTEHYLSEWGRDRFGPVAGYAQQYLYTYGRLMLDPKSPFRK